MKDNVVANWIVGGFSVVAFILLLKVGAGYLPDNGIPGKFKQVVQII